MNRREDRERGSGDPRRRLGVEWDSLAGRGGAAATSGIVRRIAAAPHWQKGSSGESRRRRGDATATPQRRPSSRRARRRYLDKVLRCFGVYEGEFKKSAKKKKFCDYDLLATSGAFSYSAERTPDAAPSFPAFVGLVEAATARYDICQVDHHLCLQIQGCLLTGARRLRLVRLEDEHAWFPCLAQKLRLTAADLEGERWRAWKHRPCFYGACGAAAAAPDTGSVHATGASARVAEFYDAATAAAVRRLYRADFDVLGYDYALPGLNASRSSLIDE